MYRLIAYRYVLESLYLDVHNLITDSQARQ